MPGAFVLAEGSETSHSVLIPELPDLIWGSICFLVVLVVIIWKVLPAVTKALDARREKIEGAMEQAAAARASANAALESYTEQLAEARQEAARIREQARADGQAIVAEARDQAIVESDRIKTNAIAQIESERAAALQSLRTDVGSLALDLASGVIGETLSNDQRATAVVDRFLADLESEDAGKN